MIRQRASSLDREYEQRGLVRPGVAAHLLHVDGAALALRLRDGVIKTHRFELANGHRYTGMAWNEVVDMHRVMWPHCMRSDCVIKGAS